MVTLDSGLGIHFADLHTSDLDHGNEIQFTFYWHDAERLENKNYSLAIEKNRTHVSNDSRDKIHIDRDKIKVFLPS
jgi:hypothetical protein